MEIISVTIGAILFAVMMSYFLGKKVSQAAIIRGWFRKGVEVEKKREKIREKYLRLRESVRPSIVFNRATQTSKASEAGSRRKSALRDRKEKP